MPMDLKFKGITWVGNIYQRFEAMCQEMDDIVSQDPVKYVENQVQTVGESVKKLYTDVQDLVDPVKREAQARALTKNDDIGTHIKSIEESPVDMITEQLPVNSPVKKLLVDASSGLHHVNQLIMSTSMDPLDLAPRQIGNGLINEKSDVSMEENAIKDNSYASDVLESSPDGKESFESSLLSELIDENYEHASGVLAEVSPAASAYGAGLQSSQSGGTACDNSACDNECVSDALSALTSEIPSSVVSSEEKIVETELAPVCDNYGGDNECVAEALSALTSEISSSVVSSEEKIAETELAPRGSFSLMKPHCLTENLPKNFQPKAELCNNTGDVAKCVSDSSSVLLSSTLVPNLSCKNKVDETRVISSRSSLSLELFETDASEPGETVPLTELSGNRLIHFCDAAQLEAFMHSSNNSFSADTDYINDPSMETIELRDKVKLEESCVIVDCSALHAVSRRTRKLRSYRKKIQDAFTSKKRLAKEYEQLAIWYGDCDIEFSNQGTSQISLPSKPTTLLRSNSLQSHQTSDSEWELL